MDDHELPLRTATTDDWDAISRMLAQAFHNTLDADAGAVEASVYEPERGLVISDADLVVGHAAAYTRDLTVPGNVLPAAHVTLVGVAATHRRRRLLTRMMHRQLRDIRDAGREPLAVLWASEGTIYPRFGYGLAAQKLEFTAATPQLRLRPPTAPGRGRLRPIDPSASWTELAKVYEQLRSDRPGYSSRDERWWRFVLADTPARRGGATALHAALYETTDGPAGYALWRSSGRWTATGPDGEVQVREVLAADPQAYAELWRLLLSIDLTRTVRFPFAAVDEPLIHLVNEPRRLGMAMNESLWVRLIDVPAALAGRRYRTPVDVVIEVSDSVLPENAGRWHLVGGPDTATCSRTDAPADLVCDVLDLGSAYLGGICLTALAAAGRIGEPAAGAVEAAATAFGWHRPPAATEVF